MSAFDQILEQSSNNRDGNIIKTIDMHTGGEPLRVVIPGFPVISAPNVLEYRRLYRDKHDILRRQLIFEPRGHSDMYGVFLVPPDDDQAHFGTIFFHNEGYSTMCGHAVLALAKLAVIEGWVKVNDPVTEVVMDAPCGRIYAEVDTSSPEPGNSWFRGVPSFVVGEDVVEVAGLGQVNYTLAYGGAYYAYVDAPGLRLDLHEPIHKLIRYGMDIKRAIVDQGKQITHPFESDLGFLYGVVFTGGRADEGNYDRNVCIFADGEVDRSPTGSGVSGRMAIMFRNGILSKGEKIHIESITGSVFTCSIEGFQDYGPYKAVLPLVEGSAYITGRHEFFMDPADPMRDGFLIR